MRGPQTLLISIGNLWQSSMFIKVRDKSISFFNSKWNIVLYKLCFSLAIPNTVFTLYKTHSRHYFFSFSETASSNNISCDRVFLARDGIIQSPNYPLPYNDLMDCTYEIIQPSNVEVVLVFQVFDLEEDTGCSYDYLTVSTDGIGITYC